MTAMRTAAITGATVLLAATGCGSGKSTGSPPAKTTAPLASAASPAADVVHPFGQPATVDGDKGNPVQLTPVGILYDKGPYRGTDGPVNGWFVAIALMAKPLKAPDTLQPFEGGFTWKAGSQVLTDSLGNASNTPWVGATPVFSSDQPMQVGEDRLGIQTFDVPTKGGELNFTVVGANRTVVVRWKMPAADTGTGLTSVRKRIKLFS